MVLTLLRRGYADPLPGDRNIRPGPAIAIRPYSGGPFRHAMKSLKLVSYLPIDSERAYSRRRVQFRPGLSWEGYRRRVMLIKEKDGIELQLGELHHLLGTAKLSAAQRDKVQDEIKQTKVAAHGEEKAACYINYKLRDSNDYAVLHDLRLEHEGRVAQIDHLLVNRYLDVVLIESTTLSTALRVDEHGEFEVRTRSSWKGIESPVERSHRYALVLEAVIAALDLAPRCMDVPIRRKHHHWVLVSPECSLLKPSSEQDILKMDQFGTRLEQFGNENGNCLGAAKLISSETLREFAQRLAAQHRPLVPDYAARFGIDPLPKKTGSAAKPVANPRVCAGCGVPLDSKVVFFCRINAGRFEGRLFCRACQAAMAITPKCAG